jgi:hypothetical protein
MFSLTGGVTRSTAGAGVGVSESKDDGSAGSTIEPILDPITVDITGTTTAYHGRVVPPGPSESVLFDRNIWQTFGDGDGHQEWYSRKGERKTAVAWGQLKLLTVEIQFLTLYWNPKIVPNPIAVYVGAAPGSHIVLLAKMFPKFTFHLYDPRAFDKHLTTDSEVKDRIVIHQQLFLEADCEMWKDRKDVYFVCDIRGRDYELLNTDEGHRKSEKVAWDDMQLQQSLVEKIRPVYAHLKFRLPYTYEWVRAENAERKPIRSYLDGTIYRQPWALPTSTETRLVIPQPADGVAYSKRDWNLRSYEDACFYHNLQVREKFTFLNPITGKDDRIDMNIGLTNDYDSVAFTFIVMEYLRRYGITEKSKILALTTRIIRSTHTGDTLIDKRLGLHHHQKYAPEDIVVDDD